MIFVAHGWETRHDFQTLAWSLFFTDYVTFLANARGFVFWADAGNTGSIQVTFTLHFNVHRKKTT